VSGNCSGSFPVGSSLVFSFFVCIYGVEHVTYTATDV
jgi:hypothetical protein